MSLSPSQESQVQAYLTSLWSNTAYLDSHYYPHCTSMPVKTWVENITPVPETVVREQSANLSSMLSSMVATFSPTPSSPAPYERALTTMMDAARDQAKTTLSGMSDDIGSDYAMINEIQQCAQTILSKPRTCSYPTAKCPLQTIENNLLECPLDLPCRELSNGQRLCVLDLQALKGNLRVRNLMVSGDVAVKDPGAATADYVRNSAGKLCCGQNADQTPDDLRIVYSDSLGSLFRSS